VAKEQLVKMFAALLKSRDWVANPRFEHGEVILNFVLISGDHLFVDRLSYNFVRPKRGDIFVFETKGIPVKASGQFYIKRCVGLPGETIQIKNDDRLYVNGAPVPALGPFAKIYSKSNGYFGHLNFKRLHELKPDLPSFDESLLLNAEDSFTIPRGWYFAMGDNTRESRDSRYFGPVPQRNLVGRAFFVYWPFGKRWGVPE
jgi:signal peptidase I